jgi:hypothetical protein
MMAQDAPEAPRATLTTGAAAALGALCLVAGAHVALQQRRWLAALRRADDADDPLLQRFDG